MASVRDEVLACNAAFYEAFTSRDAARMDELWSREVPLVCIHPGWQPLEGREEVMGSWRAILEGPAAPAVECERPMVWVLGTAAFVVCIERLEGGELVATNVFVRESATWKLVHHHAGPLVDEPDDDEPPAGLLN